MEPRNRFQGMNSPAYVAWRAGTITLFLLGSIAPMDSLKIPALVSIFWSILRIPIAAVSAYFYYLNI
jgi:hypothetical protein